MDARKVKRIYHPPAVPAADLFKGGKQRRVAAYARVSTATDEQLNSVEAQKDYFDKLIRQRPDWIFVDVYADEGITGTSINRREAFNRMVADDENGGLRFEIDKHRVSIRLTAPYSEGRKQVMRKSLPQSNQIGR